MKGRHCLPIFNSYNMALSRIQAGYRTGNITRILIYNRILSNKLGGKTRTEQTYIAYIDRLSFTGAGINT